MTVTVETKLRRFTVDEYERMIAAGVFIENPRVELLDGEIIEMAAIGLDHLNSVTNLTRMLVTQVPKKYSVGVQGPIVLGTAGMPEPDLFVWRRRRKMRPMPGDILLVIEVSDTTLAYDRNRKFPRYAAAGIPEAWLFDVGVSTLERHTEPRGGRYQRIEIARLGESLVSTALPEVTLAVDDILADGDDEE